jgi:hypothetical protein
MTFSNEQRLRLRERFAQFTQQEQLLLKLERLHFPVQSIARKTGLTTDQAAAILVRLHTTLRLHILPADFFGPGYIPWRYRNRAVEFVLRHYARVVMAHSSRVKRLRWWLRSLQEIWESRR